MLQQLQYQIQMSVLHRQVFRAYVLLAAEIYRVIVNHTQTAIRRLSPFQTTHRLSSHLQHLIDKRGGFDCSLVGVFNESDIGTRKESLGNVV